MSNRRCLLYVIVIVILAALETSSINDRNYRGRKINSEKLNKVNETVIRLLDRNFEGKKNKRQDDSLVKYVEHEVLIPDSTRRNETGKLATGTVSTLNNSYTLKGKNSHEQQSHSNKRQFHRSKIYRKEERTKQNGNAIKRTTNLFPSGTLLGIKSKEIFRNLTSRKRNSAKLIISELTPRPESSIRTNDDFILLANSSLYIVPNGSRELYSFNKTKLKDKVSSKISEFTSNYRRNLSTIEDKSSSVKLTTSLNFEHRFDSNSKQDVEENFSTNLSTGTKLLTESEYRSIDESEKIFGHRSTNLIPTSVKSLGNYSVINGKISADNLSSNLSASRAKPKNESSSFSPESSDEIFDRISLAGVIEVLKNIGWSENFLLKHQNSSSNTDSTEIYSNPSDVEIGSAKHSRSLKDPENIDESPIIEDSFPNYTEDIDEPFKLSVPLNFEVFIDNETKKENSRKSEIFLPIQFSTKSLPNADSTRPESSEFEKIPNPRMVIKNVSIEGQNIPSSSDIPISVTEIDEPIVRESFRESDETTIDPKGIENIFGELENCNASSLSPTFDSFSVEMASKEFRDTLNVSTTTTEPENFYIIEGFRFFKNIGEESPESEDDLERNDAVSIDYGDTEIYPKIEGFLSSLKDIDRIEPETKEEAAVILRKGNFGVRREDTSWWSNPDGKEGQKDVREIQKSADEDVQQRIESVSSNRIFLSNPGIYAIVGICLIVVIGGFSLWWNRTPLRRRRTTLPKMNRFVQQRGETRNTVV